jgi:hypothetical protein
VSDHLDNTVATEKSNRYYGKYRATVINNLDPENRGRIQAMVPDVLGLTPSTWALPCLPVAGKGSSTFPVPELGAGVWMEFEQGNPDYPIWTGIFSRPDSSSGPFPLAQSRPVPPEIQPPEPPPDKPTPPNGPPSDAPGEPEHSDDPPKPDDPEKASPLTDAHYDWVKSVLGIDLKSLP